MSEEQQDLRELRGCIATCNLTGQVQAETMEAYANMRAWNTEHGLREIEYFQQPAQLVEAGRDAICSHALKEKYDWLCMFDGDATFQPDAFARLLHTAYEAVPDADVVGAYCQLRNTPYLPTIDTGTGTWEAIYPNSGVLPVIRTGGHFLLVKTGILVRFGPPWFRARHTKRLIDAFLEVDNYARCHLDGGNPFRALPEWEQLTNSARKESLTEPSNVGEDSGFSDRVKAVGGRIYVDTAVITGHVTKRVLGPQDFVSAIKEREKLPRLAVGVL